MKDPPSPPLPPDPSADPEAPAPLPGVTSSGWGPLLRVFAAGLGSLLLAAGFASLEYRRTPLLGMGDSLMGRMMEIQILVILSFPFITLFAVLRPSKPGWKVAQWCVVWTLLGLFIHGAWLSGKWEGLLTFAGLTLATYLGFLLHLSSGAQILRLGLRWLISFIVYLTLAGVTRMPESVDTWHQDPKVYRFGFLYFLTLTLVEWTGLYQGRWLDRTFEAIRRSPPK